MNRIAIYVLLLLTGSARAWFASAWSFKGLSWSPDSRWLCLGAYCSVVGDNETENGEDFVLIVPVESTGHWYSLLPSRYSVYPSHSGEQLALAGPAGIFVLNLTRNSLKHLASPFKPNDVYDRSSIDCIAWSPDETHLAYSTYDDGTMTTQLCIVDTARQTATLRLPDEWSDHCPRIHTLRWKDSGTLLLRCGDRDLNAESSFCRVDLNTGRFSPATSREYHGARPLRPIVRIARDTTVSTNVTEYLPGSATLRTRPVRDTLLDYVVVVDFPSRPDRSFRPPIVNITSIQNGDVSPDGKLVYFEWTRTSSECDVDAAPELYTIEGHPFQGVRTGSRPLWLKDGNRFLSYNQSGYAVTRTDGSGRFIPVTGQLHGVSISPDSTRLALELVGEFGPLVGVAHVDSPSYRPIRGLRSPQWVAWGRRLLCQSEDGYVLLNPDGSLLYHTHLVSFGHSPWWPAESIILFQAGQGRRGYESSGVILQHRADEPVWQINPFTGQMHPATTEMLNAYKRYRVTNPSDTIRSPDGRYLAWIESKHSTARLWASPSDGSGQRQLLDAWANYSGWLDRLEDDDSGNKGE